MSEVLGLPTSTILAWARSGLLTPQRDGRGSYVFSFQDIALLRSARELLDAEVPARKVRQTLEALRANLPPGRPLSAVNLTARGGRVVVREDNSAWEADTGQFELGLGTSPREGRQEAGSAPPACPTPEASASPTLWAERTLAGVDADALFDAAVDMEATEPVRALAAYRRVIQVDPRHGDAHLNLGRLLHERGALSQAEGEYRAAAELDPGNARAHYNLGVVLEDLGRPDKAVEAYLTSLSLDPELGAAHFNLSRLLEAEGRPQEALRHLASYKRILDRGHGGA